MRRVSENWKNYGIEFLSIFIAVIAAFALNNWNDNRRDEKAENKILTEIANGLNKDIDDINQNISGHHLGIAACNYFRNALIPDSEIKSDSLLLYYFSLTRDFVSVQNTAGYATLKSKGLELISNDSLRTQIIALYEYDYNTLRKLEEEYQELQFHTHYNNDFTRVLAPNIQFDKANKITGVNSPLAMSQNDRSILLLHLWKIQNNRLFILQFYSEVQAKISEISALIENELNS